MKALSYCCLFAGIALILFNELYIARQRKTAMVNPIENMQHANSSGWVRYVCGAVMVTGLIGVWVGKKKTA